uniref:Uncharacterized protein n=1 Tax=Cacopsylla melanoneura TaxID=428564 RepID=A0A8D8LNS7_9HEMI
MQELRVTCWGQAGDGKALKVSCSYPSRALFKSEKQVESEENATFTLPLFTSSSIRAQRYLGDPSMLSLVSSNATYFWLFGPSQLPRHLNLISWLSKEHPRNLTFSSDPSGQLSISEDIGLKHSILLTDPSLLYTNWNLPLIGQ